MTKGIEHELNFWRKFVQTPRFLEGWCSGEKTPELREPVYSFIVEHLPAKVLDCGSGVCSILTGTVPNEDLVACDLLAKEYAKFFNYKMYNVVKPLPLACEYLKYEEEFDIVHISNAIDHTQNVQTAVRALWRAVKKDGYFIIQGFENEGLYENWRGLHQYNVSINDDVLEIRDQHTPLVLLGNAEVLQRDYIPELDKYWITYIAKK